MTETVEHTARRIAERGRGALEARLRPAFQQAAAAHSDVMELDSAHLEELIQRAVDRADGLQWRRALASVASEELGIGLGEALGHPAVARAQAIVGAPSYEESLATLGSAQAAVHAPSGDEASKPESEAPKRAAPAGEVTLGAEEPSARAGAEVLRLPVVHLGGVADLGPREGRLELRISEDGLDIVRGSGDVLGRLAWGDLRRLEALPSGRLRRRRRQGHLVVRTDGGEASFDVQGLRAEELRKRLLPFTERHLKT